MINDCNDDMLWHPSNLKVYSVHSVCGQTAAECRSVCTGSRLCFPCVCVCVRGMFHTVWEQVLPLYRKDIRNNKSVGGEGGRQTEGGGLSGNGGNERRTPSTFTTKPLPLPLPHSPLPPPPTSVKCPSSTISALQRGTTTNSASLTSHSKHSCLSTFACCPFIPATLEMCFGADSLLWEGSSVCLALIFSPNSLETLLTDSSIIGSLKIASVWPERWFV